MSVHLAAWRRAAQTSTKYPTAVKAVALPTPRLQGPCAFHSASWSFSSPVCPRFISFISLFHFQKPLWYLGNKPKPCFWGKPPHRNTPPWLANGCRTGHRLVKPGHCPARDSQIWLGGKCMNLGSTAVGNRRVPPAPGQVQETGRDLAGNKDTATDHEPNLAPGSLGRHRTEGAGRREKLEGEDGTGRITGEETDVALPANSLTPQAGFGWSQSHVHQHREPVS